MKIKLVNSIAALMTLPSKNEAKPVKASAQ